MNLKKIFRVLLLVSLPLLLVACSSSSGFYSGDLAGNAAAANTDISIGFLAQIFGTVGSTLQGNNNQLLGQLFYQFNLGVLMLIGVWLIYTVLTAALRGANEGSFVGQQGKNVAYNCLRIALGIAMVLPNPSTGYNLFQELIMDVTVAGVHLADNVWVATVDYLNEGHAVWVNPSNSNNTVSSTLNADTFNAFMGKYDSASSYSSPNSESPALGYNVMLAEVCMVSSGDTTLRPSIDAGTSTYIFPSKLDSTTPNAGCGTVDWSQVAPLYTEGLCVGQDSYGNTYPSAVNAMYCQQEQNSVAAVINDLMPAALMYYCNTRDGEADPTCSAYSSGTSDDIANDFYLADIDYTNNMYGAYDQATSAGVNSASNLKTDGSKDGWMMAGRYYWDMTNLSQVVTDMDTFKQYKVDEGKWAKTTGVDMRDFNTAMGMNSDAGEGTYLYDSSKDVVDYADALDDTNSSTSSGSSASFVDGGWGFVDIIGGNINSLVNEFKNPQSQSNPIAWLTKLGQSCIAAVGNIWLETAVLIFSVAIVSHICGAESPAGGAFDAVTSWMKPFVLAVCGLLLTSGATFGYYVPLYPYMIFTFGSIVWLIAVIEAMVAAPLVAFGLTHPDGHDFLGNAQQAVMLALGVFLRPALMIFGLVGGMILSFVAFKIVNYTFVNFMQDLFTNSIYEATSSQDIMGVTQQAVKHASNSSSSGVVAIMTFPIILVIFASIVMEVTHQCYSLIHVLPDYVLRWIGGPSGASPGSVEGMAKEVSGSIGKAAGPVAEGISSGMDKSLTAAAKDYKPKAKNEVENKGGGGGGGASGAAGAG